MIIQQCMVSDFEKLLKVLRPTNAISKLGQQI